MDSLFACDVKSDFNTDVFLQVLQNFREDLVCETYANRCLFVFFASVNISSEKTFY